jgi:hypothetical protein
MKNAEVLYQEHQLVAFIEGDTLTVRNQAGKELVTNCTKFVPLNPLGQTGAARVIARNAGEVKIGEDFYAIRVRARFWMLDPSQTEPDQ